MFRDLGVPVIDADAMARRIVEPGRRAWKAIKYVLKSSHFEINFHEQIFPPFHKFFPPDDVQFVILLGGGLLFT